MPFTYDPKSVVEKEFVSLPEGYYSFETISATESVSKSSGKDMLVLDLKVFDTNGKSYPHTMYITQSSLYQLKNFWDSVGYPEMFDSMANNLKEMSFMGKCGILKTRHEETERDGNKYTNSRVHYFIKKKDQDKVETIKNGVISAFPDDDVPF